MVASPLRSAIYRNMFALGTLAFIGISLFMVHEFEEIICVRPYIKRHREDEKFAAEMFVAGGDQVYPSTESIALMIGEEFVLSVIIMLVGIAVGSIEIVLAPFIAFTLHLIPHALEALRFPGWARQPDGGATVRAISGDHCCRNHDATDSTIVVSRVDGGHWRAPSCQPEAHAHGRRGLCPKTSLALTHHQ